MKRRTIVIFGPGITEPGGAARRTFLFAEGLAARGWRVRLITRAGTLTRMKLVRKTGVTALEIPGFRLRRFGAFLYALLALPLGIIWGLRAQAFIAIQLTSQSIVAGVCSFVLRRPYLSFLTTGGSLSELDYIRRSRVARLRQGLLSRASYLVAQTPESAAELSTVFPRANVSVLPNPVELGSRAPLTGRHRACFAGRLSVEKDLGTLLDAWKPIARDYPAAELLLIGEGGQFRSDEERLRGLVSQDEHLRRSVTFTGWVPNPADMMQMCDVFVLPSVSEGMSNALLEACALGRVVIASRIPSNVYVLGSDYPLLFDPSDVVGLTTQLRKALDVEHLRQAARDALVRGIGEFSKERIAENLERMIDLALPSGRASPRKSEEE